LADRFRLVYLKSTGPEGSIADDSRSSHDSKEMLSVASSAEAHHPETFSYQTILTQAKDDLRHPDPKVRVFAIQYLEGSEASTAIPLLEGMLPDQDPGVRAKAISSLVKFRSPAIAPLLKKYLKDGDPMVRIAALRGIFQLREGIDLNLLLQLLSDESPWVRRKVATLLGWVQMEGVFPILMEMSKDHNSKVRKAALFSLMTLYPEESEDRLVEAATDSDPDLRRWAGRTLQEIMARPFKVKRVPLANRV